MKRLTETEMQEEQDALYIPCLKHEKWTNVCLECLAKAVFAQQKLITRYKNIFLEDDAIDQTIWPATNIFINMDPSEINGLMRGMLTSRINDIFKLKEDE